MRDLDELISTCRTEDAKDYIRDAVASYRAGAYRASIAASWIAVVYDLISKIRELAISGDAEAKARVAELDGWQPGIETGDMSAIRKSLDFERNVIEYCHAKFGFFDGMQLTDLKRLHDDRNRCAHPTFNGEAKPYSPSAELARSHLTHAVMHVLSQAPVQGKAATEAVLNTVRSDLFPIEIEEAKIALKSAGLLNARDSLFSSIIDHLTFSLFEKGNGLYGQLRTVIAIDAVHQLKPEIVEPRIRKHANQICRSIDTAEMPIIVGLQNRFPLTWSFLEQDNRKKVKRYVETVKDNASLPGIVLVALSVDDLESTGFERVQGFSAEQFQKMMSIANRNKMTPRPAVIDLAVSKYCSSKSYHKANENYAAYVEPIIAHLAEEHIVRIIRAPSEEDADLIGAHSFSEFVSSVHSSNLMPRQKLEALLHEMDMSNYVESLTTISAEPE